MSLPEVVLWQYLRGGKLKRLKFRRQHAMGPFVLDFYCAEAKVCIEVDGAAHDFVERAERDASRDSWLAERGVKVLRFLAADVLDDRRIDGVLATIAETCGRPLHHPSGGPPPPLRG
jgi:very-short-patch-repair endonuclease